MQSTFAWSKDYETGNLMVDREHQALLKLVSLILTLDQKEDIKERNEALRVELEALHRYVDQHFIHEEKLLEAVNSMYLAKQRLQHNALRSELDFLWMPGQQVASRETIHKITLWAREQLLVHFLTADFEAFHSSPFNSD